jgi:hypothetical protein
MMYAFNLDPIVRRNVLKESLTKDGYTCSLRLQTCQAQELRRLLAA